MRKTLATLTLIALAGTAHAATFHYACKSSESRYALTVNTDRGIVKVVEIGGPRTVTTFRILKVAPLDVCAKYGLILNGATFCTATQGVAGLDWHGHESLDCDAADTESIMPRPPFWPLLRLPSFEVPSLALG
jgi:hypothetical protein